jgi:hypothetical protein
MVNVWIWPEDYAYVKQEGINLSDLTRRAIAAHRGTQDVRDLESKRDRVELEKAATEAALRAAEARLAQSLNEKGGVEALDSALERLRAKFQAQNRAKHPYATNREWLKEWVRRDPVLRPKGVDWVADRIIPPAP